MLRMRAGARVINLVQIDNQLGRQPAIQPPWMRPPSPPGRRHDQFGTGGIKRGQIARVAGDVVRDDVWRVLIATAVNPRSSGKRG